MGKEEMRPVTMRLDTELLKRFDTFVENIGADRRILIQMFMTRCVEAQKLLFEPREKDTRIDSDEIRGIVRDVRRGLFLVRKILRKTPGSNTLVRHICEV